MPNPSYVLYDRVAMLKISDLGTQIQVCGDPAAQTINSCNPYVCESRIEDKGNVISRSFRCGSDIDVGTDLRGEGDNFKNLELVDNQDDWFERLQYWFEI